MTPGARRAKGKRLPIQVAEAFCREFDMTIAAAVPKDIGKTRNDVKRVQEAEADIIVRQSGQPGSDVVLNSEKAVEALCWPTRRSDGLPLWIECKNDESWEFGPKFWKTNELPKFIARAWKQATKAGYAPAVVLSKNRHRPIVITPFSRDTLTDPLALAGPVMVVEQSKLVMTLDDFITELSS